MLVTLTNDGTVYRADAKRPADDWGIEEGAYATASDPEVATLKVLRMMGFFDVPAPPPRDPFDGVTIRPLGLTPVPDIVGLTMDDIDEMLREACESPDGQELLLDYTAVTGNVTRGRRIKPIKIEERRVSAGFPEDYLIAFDLDADGEIKTFKVAQIDSLTKPGLPL